MERWASAAEGIQKTRLPFQPQKHHHFFWDILTGQQRSFVNIHTHEYCSTNLRQFVSLRKLYLLVS